jgi:hypothetical protein
MTNDSVLKLTSSGLGEDLIVQTINATPGHYDTSTDGLIALKKAGLTDREVAAMLLKNTAAATTPAVIPAATTPTDTPAATGDASTKPRIYLQSESHGVTLKSRRDQSMEMSKDFEKNCPAVRITINPAMAAYTIMLNHVEGDFSRTNQFQIADKNGDLISKTKQGGTISGDVKRACAIITADWNKTSVPPAPASSPEGAQ